jgi:Calpain family cysteine protease
MSSRESKSSGYQLRKSRSIRLEQLEDRTLSTINNLQSALQTFFSTPANSSIAPIVKNTLATTNTAPTFSQGIHSNGKAVTTVTTRSIDLASLGADDKGEALLTYRWQVTQTPIGGQGVFTTNGNNAAKRTSLVFSKAGLYGIELTITDRDGKSVKATQQITVNQSLASVALLSSNNSVLPASTTFNLSTASQAFKAVALDQFGTPMAVQPKLQWSTVFAPAGSSTSIVANGNSAANISFNRSGTYTFQVQLGSTNTRFVVNVSQKLTTVKVTPGDANITTSSTKQFTAQGFDQFQQAMVKQPTFSWTTTGGTISSQGLLTAPTAAVTGLKITAQSATVSAFATVTVTASSKTDGGVTNATLANLVKSFTADGSINRLEMIQLLRAAGLDGTVDTTELTDLRGIVSNATKYNIAGYVQTLANNVVNTNPANGLFQGTTLGNLAVGSTATVLNKLIDKWFLGTDRPTLTNSSISYAAATGPLFVGAPSYTNEKQGALGDCYFIATLGSLASSNAESVRNMFIDNGDGTYTVRFFGGTYGAFYNADGTISDGFANGVGTADYVTVDRMLPAYSNGTFAYSNAGISVKSTTAPLWIVLAEKAYAQWNANGKSGRNGVNSYASIEGGWMGAVNAQVLGRNASRFGFGTETDRQALIQSITSNKAVTLGTKASNVGNGLVGSHAYSVVSYNAANGTFVLNNPWGSHQPGPLTWAQLQANCSAWVVANATQVAPFLGPAVNSGLQLKSELAASTPAIETFVIQTTDADNHSTDWAENNNIGAPARDAIVEIAADEYSELADEEFASEFHPRGLVDMLADLDALESLLSQLSA